LLVWICSSTTFSFVLLSFFLQHKSTTIITLTYFILPHYFQLLSTLWNASFSFCLLCWFRFVFLLRSMKPKRRRKKPLLLHLHRYSFIILLIFLIHIKIIIWYFFVMFLLFSFSWFVCNFYWFFD
jgi:hypothetical protein